MSNPHQLSVVGDGKVLTFLVYALCKHLLKTEQYGLISQMCRAAISVPSNIVEGQQKTDKDFKRFITISRGSLYELQVQIEIVQDLYKIDCDEILYLIDKIGAKTYKLMQKLNTEADKHGT